MSMYYCAVIAINILSAVFFHEHINISAMSGIPLFLIALTVFQANYFIKDIPEKGFDTSYGGGYTHEEKVHLLQYASKSLMITIPLLFPFILFFPNAAKVLSVIVYIAGFIVGPLVYRVRHRHELNSRANAEKAELAKQKQNEELGKWK